MPKLSKDVSNQIGWIGAFSTLSAFFLVSFTFIDARSVSYQLLNLSGAIGLGIICYVKKAYQPLFVNIVWGCIALVAIIDLLLH